VAATVGGAAPAAGVAAVVVAIEKAAARSRRREAIQMLMRREFPAELPRASRTFGWAANVDGVRDMEKREEIEANPVG
jgi:hypothetical protein